jgi:large subunit ribosomal protein L29
MSKALKNKDIWALSAKERAEKVEELRNDLMHERGTAAMGGALRSPGKVRALRTSIARVLTIQNQAARTEQAKKERKAKQERAAAARKAAEAKPAAKEETTKPVGAKPGKGGEG